MAYLVSESTMRQLKGLIEKRPEGYALPSGGRLPADLGETTLLPFDLYWCRSAAKFRVYIPEGCAVFGDKVATVDTASMTAVDGQTGWYAIAAPSEGATLYAVATADGGAVTLKVCAGDSGTAALALAGFARPVAKVAPLSAAMWSVQPLWRGAIGPDAAPDSVLESGNRSLALVEVDGVLYWQIYGFDSDAITEFGVTDILHADPESGEITAENGDKYFVLVQIVGSDGVRRVARMPFGPGSGEDDEQDPQGSDTCGVGGYPGDDDAGDDYPGSGDPNAYPGSGTGDEDGYPGKIDDCW